MHHHLHPSHATPALFLLYAEEVRPTANKPLPWQNEPLALVAAVRMPARSLPAPGSVMAIARIFSPLHMAGRYFCFCSSVPDDDDDDVDKGMRKVRWGPPTSTGYFDYLGIVLLTVIQQDTTNLINPLVLITFVVAVKSLSCIQNAAIIWAY